jgi:NodT family efflux transporter outer membrane factor (OMF) lipoprotein
METFGRPRVVFQSGQRCSMIEMRRAGPMLIRLLGCSAAVVVLLLPFGCRAAGPDYQKPQITPPATWRAAPPDIRADVAVSDRTLAQWWTTLDDPLLESLLQRAVQGNLDLRRARAVLWEARARRGIVDADRFPTVTGSALAAFQRGSNRMGDAANAGLFSLGFDAGWEVDVFGRVRRSIEAADASLEATEESLRDTLVSLLAEVALNYVEIRQYQQQLLIAEGNLGVQEEIYALAARLYQAGLTTRVDVDQAEYSAASTRSAIPTLRIQLEQAKNRLAVLLGENPGALSDELSDPAPIPVGPVEVAVGIPAETLRRRPDVRRAERALAAQTAAIGVAEAARYPHFGLSGSIGYDAVTKGNPLSLGNLIGSVAGSAFHTLFDAGRIRQQIEVQNARQEQALIDYEATILGAFQEVENALIAYADEQVRRESLIEAAEAAGRALDLVRANYAAGLVSFQPVLDSQRALLSLQDQLARSDGAITSHLIRLYKALGGGWTPAPSPDTSPDAQPQTGSVP